MPTTTTTQTTGACRPIQQTFPSGSEEQIRAGAASPGDRAKAGADRFLLTLWTDDPDLAARADEAGIDRVGVDLETLGKHERQAGLGTWISPHTIDRIPAVRERLAQARLFARLNPPHEHIAAEIELLLAHGVQVLMLPMFQSAEQVSQFIELVDGRAELVLLLETLAAAQDIERIVAVRGVSEIHIGINDLALSLGLRNRFGVFDCELTEHVSRCVRDAGLRFGIGGIGRVGDDSLPIASELIYAQYPRLGATAALISRAFLRCEDGEVNLIEEVARSRDLLAHYSAASQTDLRRARQMLGVALVECSDW